MTERREPATEVHRHIDWCTSQGHFGDLDCDCPETPREERLLKKFQELSAEREATDARVAALGELATYAVHMPDCPDDGRCWCGFEGALAAISDLPTAERDRDEQRRAVERPLDVERLARALYVIWPNDPTWFAEPPWYRNKARAIAAEYARLSETPEEGADASHQ